MSRAGVAAALATALVLGSACRPTEWPSDADPERFCTEVSEHYLHGPDEELRRIGTPGDLPYQARRYLLDRDHRDHPVPGDQEVLRAWVGDHC